MRLTVLGSGNAFHDDGRQHAALLLAEPGRPSLLVDAGSSTLLAARRFDIDLDALGGLLVTHFHGDHLFGLPFLLLHMSEMLGRTAPLELAGPPGLEERCRALVALAYPRFECRFPLEFGIVETAPFEIAGWSVEARPVTHVRESVGYRITLADGRTIAISGDAAFDDKLARLVAGADAAVLELTLAERGPAEASHVALPTLAERRAELDVPRLIFVHTDDRAARGAIRLDLGVAASDGDVIDI